MIYLIVLDINEFMFYAMAQSYAEHAKKMARNWPDVRNTFANEKVTVRRLLYFFGRRITQ